MQVTRRESYKKQDLLTLREHLRLPSGFFLVGSVLLIFLVFFCVVLLCDFVFCVPCCGVRYNFRIKTTFGSSLLPFVCSLVLSALMHVLFMLFVFVYV